MSKEIKRELLICPKCKNNNLVFIDNKIICACGSLFSYSASNKTDENKYYFVSYNEGNVTDFLDKIKYKFKRFSKFYNFLITLISPVYPFNLRLRRFIKKFITGEGDNSIALNIGSGNTNLGENISNIDIYKYENVDLTADLSNLPIKDESVDVIINSAVLEHVPFPEEAVLEFNRILKKDGVIYCFFPFMQGFHASPYDFSRRTIEGLKILFKDFKILELRDAQGPTSGFLWVFQEWLAILLSFGIKPLYLILHLIIMLITFPLKFLDFLLIKHPMGKNITSGFIVIARK